MGNIDVEKMQRISSVSALGGYVSEIDKKYYNDNLEPMKLLMQSINDHWQKYAKLIS